MASSLGKDGESWEKRTDVEVKGEEKTMRAMAKKKCTALIFPDEKPFHCWSVLVALLLIYSILVTPYRIAFIDTDPFEWFVLDTIIDMLFFTDMLITSVLVYYDQEKNLVTSHKQIFVHYLKSWFVFDLVACFPLQLVIEERVDVGNLLRLARFTRLSKLIRMTKVLRMFKLAKTGRQIFRYMNQLFLISLAFERLFWFVVTLAITLHLITCGWVFIGRFNMDTDANNWITVYEYADLNGVDLYIVAMYYTITTVATVGYGDIHACNQNEMIACSVIVLIGACVYTYLVGSLTNLLGSLDTRKAKLNQKMQLLNELAKEFSFNQPFKEKVAGAIEYQHRNVNKDIDELTNTLPTLLKNQLLVIMHRKKIEKNVFFEGKPDNFVAYLAPFLRPFRLEDDEIVYQTGQLATEMYFLVTGEVEFVLQKQEMLICYVSVSANYYFGELDLLFADDNLRMHTTKTAKQTELLALPREQFKNLLKTFEAEAFEILALAGERRIRIEEIRHKAETDFKAKQQVAKHYSVPLQLKDRIEKTASMREKLQQEGALTIDQQLLLLSEQHEAASSESVGRMNTFGDVEYSQFPLKEDRLGRRLSARERRGSVSNEDLMQRILRLQVGLERVTELVESMGEVSTGFPPSNGE